MGRETDVAWAAGFVDGEGHIGISRGYFKGEGRQWGPYHHMKLTVTQRVRGPLDKLVDLFGGSVCKARSRDLFIWTCTTRKAAAALREMLPYLTVKHDQAVVALVFQERRKAGGGARADHALDEAARDELARLKRVA